MIFVLLYVIYLMERPGKNYQCEECGKMFRNPKKCKEHERECGKNKDN